MSLLIWLLIIVIATFWHELGHYLAARAQGVAVKSFSVGMGPVLARRTVRGTEWRLSALPIGGYVEIDGMAPVMEDGRAKAPTTGFARLGAPGKIAILLAGPVFNVVLALALLAGYYTTQGVTTPLPDRARIATVSPGSLAERLGLRAGDVVVAIDGRDIPPADRVDGAERAGYLRVQDALATSGRKVLTVERGGAAREVAFDWTASTAREKRLLGIRYGPDARVERVNLFGGLAAAGRTTVELVPQALGAFGNLFRNFLTLNVEGNRDPNSGVVGPVGQVGLIGQAAQAGAWTLVLLAGGLNLSLAFFNLLPIPGLDGGRIFLVLVGAVLRRRLTFEQENLINFAGFAFVMLLMLFVVFSDVSRYF